MNAIQPDRAPKYRLRFLLQEFDPAAGETLIGRSADCHITIFDPSISRRHARITVDNDQAVLEDLGSRNGCRVNGSFIKGQAQLHDGDRIRIGTQELVFSDVRELSRLQHRQTGSLCFCAVCSAAYPREMVGCPHCGSTLRGPGLQDPADEDTESTAQRRSTSMPPRY